jgi:lactaldehyde dehydrogenase/glycolaldehyde dehydrogenase
MPSYQNFINGKFVVSSGKDRIEVTNPSTGKIICDVPESQESDVDAALSAAVAAQRDWAKRPAIERAKVLRTVAEKIRHNVEPLARVITEEQGKILDLARIEVAFTADYIDYMAEFGSAHRRRDPRERPSP